MGHIAEIGSDNQNTAAGHEHPVPLGQHFVYREVREMLDNMAGQQRLTVVNLAIYIQGFEMLQAVLVNVFAAFNEFKGLCFLINVLN